MQGKSGVTRSDSIRSAESGYEGDFKSEGNTQEAGFDQANTGGLAAELQAQKAKMQGKSGVTRSDSIRSTDSGYGSDFKGKDVLPASLKHDVGQIINHLSDGINNQKNNHVQDNGTTQEQTVGVRARS